jgi:hypothetical protein
MDGDVIVAKVSAARAAGIDPADERARPVVDEIVATYALAFGRTDDTAYRLSLLDRMETAGDPRVERYWALLATINGWPAQPSLAPVFEWFISALRSATAA